MRTILATEELVSCDHCFGEGRDLIEVGHESNDSVWVCYSCLVALAADLARVVNGVGGDRRSDTKCRICGGIWNEDPGTGHCVSQHGLCGICGGIRAACKCLRTDMSGKARARTEEANNAGTGRPSFRERFRSLVREFLKHRCCSAAGEVCQGFNCTGSIVHTACGCPCHTRVGGVRCSEDD